MPFSIFTLWPGLTGLIRFGRFPFFFLALGFSAAAGLVLSLTGCWSDWITGSARIAVFAGLAAVWLILTLTGHWLSRHYAHQLAYDHTGDRFLRILNFYLAGNWAEAERRALAMLERNQRDPEVLLLLATLHRHNEKPQRALQTLEQLEKLDSSRLWSFEIAAEREFLTELDEIDENNPELENIPFPGRSENYSEENTQTYRQEKQNQAG